MTFQINASTKVQKSQDISNHENNVFCVKPLEIFSGKDEVCDMTLISGAFDKSVFDENTILIKISEECVRHRCVYIGEDMICVFLINDKSYKNISSTGNNLTPYSIGEENIYF